MTINIVQQPTTTSPIINNNKNNIKRNLFGLKLNHDLLKTDLNDMWKESIDRQMKKWNFDFEHLCPLPKKEQQQQQENEGDYEWYDCTNTTEIPEFYKITSPKLKSKLYLNPVLNMDNVINVDDDDEDKLKTPVKRNLCRKLQQTANSEQLSRKHTLRSTTQNQKFKQQSLLDMFQQRKRRRSSTSKSPINNKKASQSSSLQLQQQQIQI